MPPAQDHPSLEEFKPTSFVSIVNTSTVCLSEDINSLPSESCGLFLTASLAHSGLAPACSLEEAHFLLGTVSAWGCWACLHVVLRTLIQVSSDAAGSAPPNGVQQGWDVSPAGRPTQALPPSSARHSGCLCAWALAAPVTLRESRV